MLKACRARDSLLPVVVMSGHQGAGVRRDASLASADSFLAKPFSLTLLGNHLRHWLERASSSRPGWGVNFGEDILTLEQVKESYVSRVVRLLSGNVTEAARWLQLDRHIVAALVESDGVNPRLQEGE